MSDSPPADPMLESCSSCGGDLDVTAFEPFTNVICPHCENETRVKRQLGTYYLERRYAVGGMSVVYLATDQTLNREVAVKILNEKYSVDETRVAAFEREARLTASVNHPNVVRVFTVGRSYGRFYLVMELLKGQSFEAMMSERGALPEDEVLEIALQVAEGLKAANDSGMLHRDVKPGNILLNEKGAAKLVDFGLALITQGGAAQAEEVWATPYYVPPEALERGTEDFRSDLYAFGATLYHAFCGKPPFESTSNGVKVLRRAKQTIPRLGKVAPWLGDATCEAIDRMMAYQPKHRWESYEDVIKVLTKARREAGQSSGQVMHGQTRTKRRVKNKMPKILVGSALALCLLGGVLWFWSSRNQDESELAQPDVIEPKPTEMTPIDDSLNDTSRLTEAWSAARQLVAEGKYDQAEAAFLDLVEQHTLQEPTNSFVQIEALVSAYFDGRAGEARARAKSIYTHLQTLGDSDDTVVQLAALTKTLSEISPPREEDFPSQSQSIIDWMSTVVLSLKLWEQGQIGEAVAQFKDVRDAEISTDYAWFSVYQKQAALYLKDAELMSVVESMETPLNRQDAQSQIDDLESRLTRLKTKGRLQYNVRSRQAYLTRIRKGYELRPDSQPEIDWESLAQVLETKAKECQFASALELLERWKEEEDVSAVRAWTYLFEGGQSFLKSLQAASNWKVSHVDDRLLRPNGATEEGVVLRSGKTVPWSELKVESLLEAHRSLMEAQEDLSERSKMREHRIAFAWLAGATQRAEEEADALAGENKEFRKTWRQVVIGLSH